MSVGTHAATEAATFRPRRERATLSTWRGHLWAIVVAIQFYELSNPLVFEPVFGLSLQRAVLVTAVAVVISIPWLRVPRVNLTVLAFFGWGLASALWSVQPGATLATVGLYLTLAAVAVMTYANVTGSVLALGFIYGGVGVTVLSWYSFWTLLPGAFFDTLDGYVLAGVGTNPNILAYTVTLAMCGWLALWPRGLVGVGLWLGAGVVLLYGVWVSESTSGELTAAAILATAAGQWVVSRLRGRLWARRRRGLWYAIFGAVAIIGATAVGFSGYGPGTFSDRLPFWRATLSVAADHPIIGHGWGAVWAHPWLSAPPNPVVDQIYAAAGLALTHGHNSFVDLVIDLGMVGVVLSAAIFVTVVRTAARPGSSRGDGSADDVVRSRFAVLCVVSLLVFGVTEPLLVIPIGFWALILVTEPRPHRTVARDA